MVGKLLENLSIGSKSNLAKLSIVFVPSVVINPFHEHVAGAWLTSEAKMSGVLIKDKI